MRRFAIAVPLILTTAASAEPANNDFNGNGWGSACLNFVGCGGR